MNKIIEVLKKLLYQFLKGLAFSGPVILTIYIVVVLFGWVDNLIPVREYLPQQFSKIPGLGFIILFILFSILGYLSNTLIFTRLFKYLTNQILRVSFLKFLLISIKDLFNVFNKKESKLNKPILFKRSPKDDVFEIGFLVQEDLKEFGLEDYVCVYIPFSFGFMGKTYFVKKMQIEKELPKNIHSSQVLKFIISGGISGVQENIYDEKHNKL